MSAFIPTPFSKFGQNTRDLFKKKYDMDHKIKTLVTNSRGDKTEFGAIIDQTNVARGYVNAKTTVGKYNIEAELNTEASADSKFVVKSSKLLDGTTVEAKFNTKGDDKTLQGPGTFIIFYIFL
jgi:hypothetical protein